MSDDSYPLGQPVRPQAEPTDPNQYRPIKGRPGWLINGKGQLAREGQIPPPQVPTYPYFGISAGKPTPSWRVRNTQSRR